MKILVITNLFPNNKEPNRGVFNKQQMTELAKLCELQIVAPVAWHRALTLTLSHKWERELKVYHPRYFMIPKIGRSLYGFFFYLGIIGKVKEIYETFKFDIILATWAYPDSFGAALASKVLKKPLVIKVHGSDVNITSKYFLRRKMMVYAFKRAHKIIAVSMALKQKITELGIPGEKIEVIPNGIDTELFKPMDKVECRKKLFLPLDKKIVLFVGNLEKVKGIDILVEAMKDLPEDVHLVIVGNGSLKNKLMSNSRHCERVKRAKQSIEIPRFARKDPSGQIASACGLAMTHGLKDRVWFFGTRPHKEIPLWINAASVFCLPSRSEGCPNVLLEVLACGIPIVASNVGGVPQIIKSEDYGILIEPGNYLAISKGIKKVLNREWNREILRQGVLNYDWAENAKRVFTVLDSPSTSSEPLEQYSFSKNKIKNIIKECIASIISKKLLVWHGDRNHRLNRVALTFDDGPNPAYTPKVLDILNKYGIKATFFLVGQEAEKHRDLAKRIFREGHLIGNHSYSHKGFGALDSKEIENEILRTQNVLIDTFGKNGRLFRPPQGALNFKCLSIAKKHKFNTVLWSWELRKTNIDSIKPGDIVLFHDDNNFTLEKLPGIIEELKKKAYSFVSVDEMIKG